MRGKILIVDDDHDMCAMLSSTLGKAGFSVTTVPSADIALHELEKRDIDVLLADINMKGMDGLELCARVVSNRPDLPVIIITAFGSMETAIAAIRAGAYDFIPKPFDTSILSLMLDRAVKYRSLSDKIEKLNKLIDGGENPYGIVGKSPVMDTVYGLIRRTADTDSYVLITGESGTGKELVAKAIHGFGGRAEGPFVAVNCSAVPETLLESEFFGYRHGAFTDAKTDKKGLFLQADGGTLFLDEIGEIPVYLQAKLLRVLESRVVRPLGDEKEIPFDTRVISATNRDIEEAVRTGTVREDFYYRLNVIQIEVPPLRLRGNDILLIADYYLSYFSSRYNKKITGINKNAMEKLLSYDWPGNVRELKNGIERAVALTNHEQILVDDLPEKIRSRAVDDHSVFGGGREALISMDELEKRYIIFVLGKTNNNKSAAARILGFDRKTLYQKLKRHNIDPKV
ncbi:MAG: sigma-54-dependent Fis family transcriptional regulator [Spirochaetales bacterium]|nr:sigma-54-dependent Fis family transcriptional regulator [Spirochaetales bacterium]